MSDKIVQFEELRIKRGQKPHCSHKNMVYDPTNQTVECGDCNSHINPFAAFMSLVMRYERAYAELDRRKREVLELEQRGIILKAAKKVEDAWRRKNMVPTCPHCDEAIFPEDGFGSHRTNKEMARQRRKFKKGDKS